MKPMGDHQLRRSAKVFCQGPGWARGLEPAFSTSLTAKTFWGICSDDLKRAKIFWFQCFSRVLGHSGFLPGSTETSVRLWAILSELRERLLS